MSPDVSIGLDLGTSGLKGVALSAAGTVLARAGAVYPTDRPEPGAAEQDPAAWIEAVRQVCSELAQVVPASAWRGIGLSAMIPTLVTAGGPRDGRALTALGPAITWQDNRADPMGESLRERCGGDSLYRVTGQWVDGRYLIPMYLRIAASDPARAAETRWLLAAKDYVYHWLTGQVATDPSTAAGFGCYDLRSGQWLPEVLVAAAELADGGVPELPPVLPPDTCFPLRAEAAAALGCEPIPVCLGAADSVLGALGMGVHEPGTVAYIAGTSSVILGISAELVFDPDHRFLVTPLALPGSWGLEMDLLATGSAIRWLARLLAGMPDGGAAAETALVDLAAGVDPASAPIVLPYLSPGEQGALWNPALHGAFFGLTLAHGRADLARGLVNGIVLESRRCLEVLAETADFGTALRVAGGSAASTAFRADLADATRRTVSVPRDHDTDYSARGAALLAGYALTGTLPPGDVAAGHAFARDLARHDAESGASPRAAVPAASPWAAVPGGSSWAAVPGGSSRAAVPGGSSWAAVPAASPCDIVPDPIRAATWDELWTRHERACTALTAYTDRSSGRVMNGPL